MKILCELSLCLSRSSRFVRGSVIAVLLFSLVSSSLWALDFHGGEVDYTLRIISSEQEDLDNGSSGAVWTNVFSLRFPFQFPYEQLYLVPGISFTSLYYRYDSEKERAVPTDVEWRELTAFVPMLDTTVRWIFLDNRWGRYSTELGLGFQFPIPIKSWEVPGIEDNSGEIIPALYSSGQFVMPLFALQGAWPVSEQFDVFVRYSNYFPLYHAWDGKGLSLKDGLVFGLHLGLSYLF